MKITFAPDTTDDTRQGVLTRLAGLTVTVTDTLGDKDEQVEISDSQGEDRLYLSANGQPYTEIEFADIDTVEIL